MLQFAGLLARPYTVDTPENSAGTIQEDIMGLLDQVGGALSALTGDESSNIGQAVLKMLQDGQTGGIEGLQSAFQSSGLGDVVSSWIGTGENQAISGDQLKAALGESRLASLAEGAGVAAGDLPSKLSEILPALVDKLTPGGQIPDASSLLQSGLNLLKSKLT